MRCALWPLRTAVMALAVTFVVAAGAQAESISPTGTFGSFDASFGGSGIPKDAVMYDTGGGTTVALTAHQRYDNAAVTNDGAGNFFAAVGPDASTGGNAVPGYATWNFGFYMHDIDLSSGNTFSLYWDFDPAYGNDRSTHAGFVDVSLPLGIPPNNPHQDSQNLGMPLLSFFFNHPPTPNPPSFDPNTPGWYTFSLQAHDRQHNLLAESAIRVQVGDPVPEPASMVLMGLGLLGLGVVTRRRQR